MSDTLGNIFGETKMSTEVADPSDIADVIKIANILPKNSESVHGDVVQLVSHNPGKKFGAFYRFIKTSDDPEKWEWVMIDSTVDPEMMEDPVGAVTLYPLSGYLSFRWKDRTDDTRVWVRSDVVMCTTSSSGEIIGETVIASSAVRDQFDTTDEALELHISRSMTEAEFNSKTFFVRFEMQDGGMIYGKLTKNL